MKIHIQDALRAGTETLETLAEKYAIKAKRHNEYPNVVLVKYDQIASNLGDPLVMQARGLIMDEANNWELVAFPFTKFFNHGEPNAATIDWKTARVTQKVDGSLCTVFFYDGRWRVATSGTPDASGDVQGFGLDFKTLFWQTFAALEWDLPTEGMEDKTFMFELTAPENRIVTRQSSRRLTLIGVRSILDGLERPVAEWASRLGWEAVREFPLTTIEAVLATFGTIDPLEQEGYVIVDAAYNRIKVKHPGYIALHAMRGEGALNPKRVLSILRAGETSEVLSAFPEWKPMFNQVSERFEALVAELNQDYAKIQDIPVQKNFAAEALKTKCSAALFQLRSKRTRSIREFLAEMQIDTLVNILGVKDITL